MLCELGGSIMGVEFRSAVIFVREIRRSRGFYEGLLGQEVETDHGEYVEYKGGFGIWEMDHAQQMIFERQAEGSSPLGRDNCELYFESPDLDCVWKRLSEAGVETVQPPCEHPWAQRVARLRDPDGHIVEIGEPMSAAVARLLGQGMTVEDTSVRTSMPTEFVQGVAEGLRAAKRT